MTRIAPLALAAASLLIALPASADETCGVQEINVNGTPYSVLDGSGIADAADFLGDQFAERIDSMFAAAALQGDWVEAQYALDWADQNHPEWNTAESRQNMMDMLRAAWESRAAARMADRFAIADLNGQLDQLNGAYEDAKDGLMNAVVNDLTDAQVDYYVDQLIVLRTKIKDVEADRAALRNSARAIRVEMNAIEGAGHFFGSMYCLAG